MLRPSAAALLLFLLFGCVSPPAAAAAAATPAPLELKAWGVPDGTATGAEGEAAMRILAAFRQRRPDVNPVPATGLSIPGRSLDMIPLMQIAGDVAPAVLYVNFRQSSTYIANQFLYPLDKCLEREAGLEIPDGQLLENAAYAAALRRAPRYAAEFAERLPPQCWEVIRRECPHGAACPYVKAWGGTPRARHFHVWCLPQRQLVTALHYRKDLFAEAGLPERASSPTPRRMSTGSASP
jgi:multiple sugar transport system permease protein